MKQKISTFRRDGKDTATISIKKNEIEPEADEIIARSIIEVARGFEKMKAGSLKIRTIVILIAHETKLPQRDVKMVLNAAMDLKRLYCK